MLQLRIQTHIIFSNTFSVLCPHKNFEIIPMIFARVAETALDVLSVVTKTA